MKNSLACRGKRSPGQMGWRCIAGALCKRVAVLTTNETAFLFLVPPCSLMSPASKSRADMFKVTQSRRTKISSFYAAQHLKKSLTDLVFTGE